MNKGLIPVYSSEFVQSLSGGLNTRQKVSGIWMLIIIMDYNNHLNTGLVWRRHFVCSKETERIGNRIGERESQLPWCERRQREGEKASLSWCT